LLIAIVDPPHSKRGGDWYYRSFLPGRALAALDGVRVVYLQNHHRARKEVLREADLVVLNAVVDADLLPAIEARCLAQRVTLYEINDDFRAVQRSNPIAGFFADPANRRLLFRLARSCDALQFSVPELRRLYGHFSDETVVFENHLWEMPPPRPPRPAGQVERVHRRPAGAAWKGPRSTGGSPSSGRRPTSRRCTTRWPWGRPPRRAASWSGC